MKKIKKITRQIKDAIAYWQILSSPETSHIYRVTRIGNIESSDLQEAKHLHASVYLSRGFIDETDIEGSIIHPQSDPHQHHADYFVVKRKERVIAVARQILYKGEGQHHESFPVLEKAIIYNRSRMRILNYHPQEIVEISALVKKSGESSIAPLVLYRELWKHSLRSNHRIWVMACDVRLYERLKLLFGPTLTKIGQRTPYKGADVIPVALDIQHSVKYVQKITQARTNPFNIRRQAAEFMLKGGVK